MTRDQFEQMCKAAAELLALADRGIEVDPHTLKWANWVQSHSQTLMPPVRPAFQQQKVLQVMQNHPEEGALASWVRERTGMKKGECAMTLCYMAKTGRLAMLKIPGRSRFFLNQTALEQGRPIVEAEERRRISERTKPAAPKPVRRPVIKQPERPPKPNKENMATKTKPPAPTRPASRDAQAVIPAGLEVQVVPTPADPRYSIPADHVGPFMQEWKRLRGGRS